MKIAGKYARAVQRGTGMLPTWPAGMRLGVGDVISVGETGALRRETRLRDLVDWPLRDAVEESDTQELFRYQSDGTVHLDEEGSTPGLRLALSFSSGKSFIAVGEGGRSAEYLYQNDVQYAMAELHSQGRWKPTWRLVTTVGAFDASTVVIAETRGATALLDAALIPGTSSEVLGAIRAGGNAEWRRGSGSIRTQRSGTLVYRALQVDGRKNSLPHISEGKFADSGFDEPHQGLRVRPVELEDIGLLEPDE